MRLCLEREIGYINDIISFISEDIHKYNWIFTDIEAHVFKGDLEIQDTLFEQERFYMSGKELCDFLHQHQVLLIFGVMIAVKQTDKNILKNIPDYPIIQDNEQYWIDSYNLTIPESVMEFGFFDTSCLIFASNNESIIKKFKKQFPTAILYSDYLELE
ncbi:hypothetical protein [Bacillus sp. NPDC094077]|uniref:hypothetical protein n=1 Tax=Bacillus sp. NPDC094077 TaxID=3390932 RepID=UPI003CFE10B5